MLRNIIMDYRKQWKLEWKQALGDTWWPYIYIPVLWFQFFESGRNYAGLQDKNLWLVYELSGLLLTLFAIFHARVFPNQLNLMYHLCPISKEEKRKYLLTGYKMRVAFPVILHVILTVSLVLLEKSYIIPCMLRTIFLLFFSLSVNIFCLPWGENKKDRKENFLLPGYFEGWNKAVRVVGLIGMLFFSEIKIEGGGIGFNTT